MILYRNQIYIFNKFNFKKKLLTFYYDNPLANHFDVIKTQKLLQKKYY